MKTLFQILDQDAMKILPCMEITHRPAFSYRGFQIDVSRHFFGVDVIKQYLDVIKIKNEPVSLAFYRRPGLEHRNKKISEAYANGCMPHGKKRK